jgi:ABC-type multidrug transport system fused ATPase/permease subunit
MSSATQPRAAADPRSDFPGPEPWNPTLRDRVRWIWRFWRPHRGFLVLLLLLTLVSSGVAIAYPLVFRVILDRLAGSLGGGKEPLGVPGTVDPGTLRGILKILAVIALGRFIAGLYPGCRAWVNLKIDVGVREAVFSRILDKDFRFFNRFRTGDLVTRLMDDITEYPKLAWFSCSAVFRALESGSKLIFCVGAMFLLDWRLSLLALVPLPVMLYLIYSLRSRLRDAYQAQQVAISETNDMLEATFSGVRIVKAFNAEEGQSGALGHLLRGRVGIQFRVQRLHALVHILDLVASRFGQLIVVSVGGTMVVRGELSLGTLYAIFVYLDMLVEPMLDLPNLMVTSRQAFVCMDREEEVMRFPGGRRDRPRVRPLDRIDSIGFDGVDFRYGAGRNALEAIGVRIQRGEKVAIVGAIGSGKTTLLQVVAGLLTPTAGAFRVNDRDIREYGWDDYRTRVGYVPQESLLFSETIAENVEIGRDGAGRSTPEGGDDADWTRRMLRAVHMDEEIAEMPEGLRTILGQKGTRVSGGQRQRISIARALYGLPEVLLLDDCTASLDAENEDRLWKRLDELVPGSIVLVVSHRLATIRRADRILVLDGGRLVDAGTHEELAPRCEVYRRFLEREEEREQLLDPAGR